MEGKKSRRRGDSSRRFGWRYDDRETERRRESDRIVQTDISDQRVERGVCEWSLAGALISIRTWQRVSLSPASHCCLIEAEVHCGPTLAAIDKAVAVRWLAAWVAATVNCQPSPRVETPGVDSYCASLFERGLSCRLSEDGIPSLPFVVRDTLSTNRSDCGLVLHLADHERPTTLISSSLHASSTTGNFQSTGSMYAWPCEVSSVGR